MGTSFQLRSAFAKDMASSLEAGMPLNNEILAQLNVSVKDPHLVTLAGIGLGPREDIEFTPVELATYFKLAALGTDMAAQHQIRCHSLKLEEDCLKITDNRFFDTAQGVENKAFCFFKMNMQDPDSSEKRPVMVLTLNHIANSILGMRRGDTCDNTNFPDHSVSCHEMVAMHFLEEARHVHQALIPSDEMQSHYDAMPKNIDVHPSVKHDPKKIAQYSQNGEVDVRNILHEHFSIGDGSEQCFDIAFHPASFSEDLPQPIATPAYT